MVHLPEVSLKHERHEFRYAQLAKESPDAHSASIGAGPPLNKIEIRSSVPSLLTFRMTQGPIMLQGLARSCGALAGQPNIFLPILVNGFLPLYYTYLQ